jgi:hydrogenase-4 component B
MPLHVWLPGAHSAAPSHVSALMSGVLIKMGIYGLVRLGALFADPPLWWGGTLLALGAASGVLGVAFAIGQHDLKRLLAYHSVENIGIIVMGLGLALLGRSLGRADLVALGLAGALLHTWNHGLFKSLLFLGAGAVVHATHTREIDHLGGLARAMPRTAALFLVGAVAICGLPPLNGFVSELCVYLGLFRAVTMPGGGLAWLGAGLAAPALALIGALAVACFVKVVGAVFLGTPRTAHAAGAHEPGARMLVPMAVLAALCALIGVAPALVAPIVARAVDAWAAFALTPAAATAVAPSAAGGVAAPLADVVPFGWISVASAALIAFLAAGGWALRARLRTAPTAVAPTWDCGYAAPTPRMQYTSSSFAQMLVGLFGWALRPQTHTPHLAGLFPHKAHFQSHVPDAVLDRAALPAAARAARALGWFRWMQHGSIHAYLVYVLVTLLVLLLWRGALA